MKRINWYSENYDEEDNILDNEKVMKFERLRKYVYFQLKLNELNSYISEIFCLEPLDVTNGKTDTDSIKFGTNVTITCDVGYQINGLAGDTTFCNISEKWEPSLPPCDGNVHFSLNTFIFEEKLLHNVM